ncbi:amidase [Micromonospora sagamiensis]|uniref:Amidase/aspartyl-tRNA(Asn)/glutamyl-tRNA(Gln) amidotransferase subunit A n=2 Tax=Micromonospora sagamiensis TaxID=47875 RepID=A0A562WHI0_9ACTN|nr:amidase [Micromonospora sagamiensis]TWJ29733.1 amidase/aspartyl-tRNA(Asn)/glutamyl-tRNA(Gln) amidotransferase subunit A [Micromonospora sagamiensis]BCL17239.1 amidase family protein [Micromonospora sagamiensis]
MRLTRRRVIVLGGSVAAATGAGLVSEPASADVASDNWNWLLQQFAQYGNVRKAAPTADELVFLPAYEQLALLSRKQNRVSAVDLTEAHLRRLRQVNPRLNAFVHVTEELAREAAVRSDERYRQGRPRMLEGLTFGVKALFDFLAGVPNDFGSKPMADLGFVPPFTAVYVQRALDAGVVVTGKTNTPEFGHKGTTDNMVHGPTSTPFDPRFNAGGSSGGAAAAVASFMTALTQGSDAGGSVRIPAAMCNIAALKPSVGRWPQDAPPIAAAPFFTPGPMARTVADVAMLMQAISGPSEGDPLSMDGRLDYVAAFRKGVDGTLPLAGKRIAYSPNMDLFPVEAPVERVVRQALQAFQKAGATVDQVKLGLDEIQVTDLGGRNRRPLTSQHFADTWVLMQAGLYGHARDLFLEFGIPLDLREHKDQLTPQFAAMLDRSEHLLAEEYRHLDFLRADVLHKLNIVLGTYDYIVTPTIAVVGVQNTDDGNTLGPSAVNGVAVDPQIGWCLTYPLNFSGHPAMSLPAGFAPNPLNGPELPVGLQVIGRMKRDDEVITASAAFEKYQPWYHRYPR